MMPSVGPLSTHAFFIYDKNPVMKELSIGAVMNGALNLIQMEDSGILVHSTWKDISIFYNITGLRNGQMNSR